MARFSGFIQSGSSSGFRPLAIGGPSVNSCWFARGVLVRSRGRMGEGDVSLEALFSFVGHGFLVTNRRGAASFATHMA